MLTGRNETEHGEEWRRLCGHWVTLWSGVRPSVTPRARRYTACVCVAIQSEKRHRFCPLALHSPFPHFRHLTTNVNTHA